MTKYALPLESVHSSAAMNIMASTSVRNSAKIARRETVPTDQINNDPDTGKRYLTLEAILGIGEGVQNAFKKKD